MQGRMDMCYHGGECDNVVTLSLELELQSGSTLIYINSRAMVFSYDHHAN